MVLTVGSAKDLWPEMYYYGAPHSRKKRHSSSPLSPSPFASAIKYLAKIRQAEKVVSGNIIHEKQFKLSLVAGDL